jgi:hypothetical protein
MASYEDIKKANDATIKTEIKGRKYTEVQERIKAFRMVYPEGFINNEMVSNENGVCIFRSEVGFFTESGEKRVLGNGTAYEKESSSFINKTSYIENCETSACGRALGMAGFGIDVSVASAEEVQNAMANQEQKTEQKKTDQKPVRKATPKQLEIIKKAYDTDEKMFQLMGWLNNHGVEALEDMSIEIASAIIKKVKEGK